MAQAKPAAPKGKYAEHMATEQRPNVILQSMLELLREGKDFAVPAVVSAYVGFTVTAREVEEEQEVVLRNRNDPNGFYLAPGAKAEDTGPSNAKHLSARKIKELTAKGLEVPEGARAPVA